MIGIVLVSHSARLAEGVLELAREMSGPEVPIAACGGLDLPGQPLGTDPAFVADAIQKMIAGHSPHLEGILVLMDLGSALLSAEMALDLLPPEMSARVRLCSAPLVEGAVSAAVQARLGSTLEEAVSEASRSLEAKTSQLYPQAEGDRSPQVSNTAPAPNLPQEENRVQALELAVTNRLGLHARPAARLVQLASRYPGANLWISNVTRGTGPASMRSINALAVLGARQGHILRIEASGSGAQEALRELEQLCRDGFGDTETDLPVPETSLIQPPAPPGSGGQVLQGLAVSPGIAVGPARLHRTMLPPVPAHKVADPQAAWQTFNAALEQVRSRLQQAGAEARRRSGAAVSAIFDAHGLMLEDEALLLPARRGIFEQHDNAAWAWRSAVEALLVQYRALEDPYQRQRAADLEAIGTQVLQILTGEEIKPVQPAAPGVLVIRDLSPVDAAQLDPALVHGIAAVAGSANSHSAVLVRALGIPMAAGLGERLLEAAEDQAVIVDGGSGQVVLNPGSQLVDEFTRRAVALQQAKAQALAASAAPAVTRDGHRLEIAANIGSPAGAQAAVLAGAEAVGLFRTEFLFLDRQAGPDEEEQVRAYRQVADALLGRPLLIRTLDAGGDKPLPYLNLPSEANPFLGWRAVRVCLDRPEFFKIQLRAILRVAASYPVKIMFPMIATLPELRRGKQLIWEARDELLARGIAAPEKIETGMMVEVPSAALQAERFAAEVDFFSIGTNDLTQYTLAAERGNPKLAQLNDSYHPAVLRLILEVVQAAHARQKWVGVCGEMAGEPLAIPLLAGLGVDELSMNPPAIPGAKAVLRSITVREARELAQQALSLLSGQEVRDFLGRASF